MPVFMGRCHAPSPPSLPNDEGIENPQWPIEAWSARPPLSHSQCAVRRASHAADFLCRFFGSGGGVRSDISVRLGLWIPIHEP